MGHSWGSYLGVKTIEKYPEYYYAYMGVGQVTDQLLSEQIAYSYMKEHAKEIGDNKAIKELSRFDPNAQNFPSPEYLTGPRQYMNKYGIGITHKPISMSQLVLDVLSFKGYSVSEKIGYAKGGTFSFHNAFYHVIGDRLSESSISFRVPVYVIHGLHDYQVSYQLAKKWLEKIEAPDKKLYTFENSAHSPNMEEPERFVRTVREITDLHANETLSVE